MFIEKKPDIKDEILYGFLDSILCKSKIENKDVKIDQWSPKTSDWGAD